MRFSVGVNYWPRSSATAMWRAFDRGEIAEDFRRIAELGLDTVRFFVRWDDFAPRPDELDPVMLERLETLVSLAADARLRIMPVLFCGHQNGVNYLPAWALDRAGPRGRFPTVCGTTESPYASANTYTGPLLDAQLFFARTVGERLRAHPAIVAWDIGHAFTNVCQPSDAKVVSGEHSTQPASEYEVADWSRRLSATLREAANAPSTAGTHSDDLLYDRNIRLTSLCAPFGFASMQGSTVDCGFARNRLDPEVVPFLALLTAAFSFKRVLVTGFGNPTCPPAKFSAFERFALPGEPPNMTIAPDDSVFAMYPCLREDENAAYCTGVLERLHADGRLGAYWWCWADYAPAPLGAAPHAGSYGIVRQDGSEKPVAAALAAFARQERDVVKAHDMPMIASAYYYRTLPTSTATMYDAFLGTLDERRAAMPKRG